MKFDKQMMKFGVGLGIGAGAAVLFTTIPRIMKKICDAKKMKPKTSLHPKGGFPAIEQAPQDKILKLIFMFKEDKFPKKVNLGAGVYKNPKGESIILDSVKEAEKRILEEETHKGYAKQDGLPLYQKLSRSLLFGEKSKAIEEERICSIQSLSGTGSLSLGGKYIKTFLPKSFEKIYLPKPTWPNHHGVFKQAGLKVGEYTYMDYNSQLVDFEGLMKSIKNDIPKGSTILLHGSCHNPTGADLTDEQWDKVLELVKESRLLPFFDIAYLGFKTGNIEKDAYPLRKAMKMGFKAMIVAQSYSKNFGLYGERAGCFHLVCNDKEHAESIKSQMKLIIRREYSNPPIHGAKIVEEVLKDEKLKKQWEDEVLMMQTRIVKMRQALYDALIKNKAPGKWEHIKDQIGFFCFTGMTEAQVDRMIKEHHIYMAGSGRISIPGLNENNVEYVADAIKDCVINA